MSEPINFIEVKKGEVPNGGSVIVDFNGKKWVVFSAYNHLGNNYVKALEIPQDVETYKIVER